MICSIIYIYILIIFYECQHYIKKKILLLETVVVHKLYDLQIHVLGSANSPFRLRQAVRESGAKKE